MLSTCSDCGAPVDAMRAPARIVGARVVFACPACARSPVRPAKPAAAPAPAPAPAPAARAARRWPRAVVATAAIAGAILLGWAVRGATIREAATRVVERVVPAILPIVLPVAAASPAPEPPAPAPAPPPAPVPSSTTVVPLEGAERATPTPNGFFGAQRPGERPAECGDGHCGIDLRADEGTPVIAARAGVVSSVNRDADHRGGRFVMIDHPGGVTTQYFHLDSIVDRIEPGVHVEPGDVLGALGRTGVKSSPTHLHFAVTVGGVYVDPMTVVGDARGLNRSAL